MLSRIRKFFPSCLVALLPIAVLILQPCSVSAGTTGPSSIQVLSPSLSFEKNYGQTDKSVKFLSRGQNYTLFLTNRGAVLTLRQGGNERNHVATLGMQLLGANTKPGISTEKPLPGKHNYFIGNNPDHWHTGIPTYKKVRYNGIYNDIDLVYYGQEGKLEYDFIVAPGANPNDIQLAFKGADGIQINDDGNLILQTAAGTVTHRAPYVYQDLAAGRKQIQAKYKLLTGNTGEMQVAFQLSAYDTSRPLIIDPLLNYASYLGGNGADEARAIAADDNGNFYVTGSTLSTDFPGSNNGLASHVSSNDKSSDVFVSKYDKSGALLFSTYLGALINSTVVTNADVGTAIAVDSNGHIYVTGYTSSNGNITPFPTTTDAYSQTGFGDNDAFVSVLSNGGDNLIYSTYIGGNLGDKATGIAVDTTGKIYVSGITLSDQVVATTPFPIKNAAQATGDGNGLNDAFAFKLDPTVSGTSGLVYSTFLSGSDSDEATAIAVDSNSNAYIAGRTASSDFQPLQNSYQGTLAGGVAGVYDVFITKLDGSGALVYSTYLGGSADDYAEGIAVDSNGNAYITGVTYAPVVGFPTPTVQDGDFPVTSSTAYDPNLNNDDLQDAFVTKLSSAGNSLAYSTYLGGSGNEEARAIAVDSNGYAYVTGWTKSSDFPIIGSVAQGSYSAGNDVFVAKLDATQSGVSSMIYSDLLGDAGDEQGNSIAVANYDAYLTGRTSSTNFPVSADAAQSIIGDTSQDAFVARITPVASLEVSISDNAPVLAANATSTLLAYKVVVKNNGPELAGSITVTLTPPSSGVSYIDATVGSSYCGSPNSDNTISCDLGSLSINGEGTAYFYFNLTTSDPITALVAVSANVAEPPDQLSLKSTLGTGSSNSTTNGGIQITSSDSNSNSSNSSSSSSSSSGGGGGGGLGAIELLIGWGIAAKRRRDSRH
jgi:hypothetical protein